MLICETRYSFYDFCLNWRMGTSYNQTNPEIGTLIFESGNIRQENLARAMKGFPESSVGKISSHNRRPRFGSWVKNLLERG